MTRIVCVCAIGCLIYPVLVDLWAMTLTYAGAAPGARNYS